MIGGSLKIQNPSGFVGCIRTLMINGNYIDLISLAKQSPYG